MPEDQQQEYRAHLNRYEERLIGLRSEIEELEKTKTISVLDIDALTKHIEYLKELEANRDEEIARKSMTITGLDVQIEDKQKQFDVFQGQLSDVEVRLKESTELLLQNKNSVEEKEKSLQEMTSKADEMHRIAVQKHQEVEEKIARIKAFKETL